MRFNIDALGFVAGAGQARILSVAFDLFATTCLTSTSKKLEKSRCIGGPRSPDPPEATRLSCGVESLYRPTSHDELQYKFFPMIGSSLILCQHWPRGASVVRAPNHQPPWCAFSSYLHLLHVSLRLKTICQCVLWQI